MANLKIKFLNTVFNYTKEARNVWKMDGVRFQQYVKSNRIELITNRNEMITLANSRKKWYRENSG